jgi:hypothetical protein
VRSHAPPVMIRVVSTVDVAGASATELTRIKNWDQVTGVYLDALSENHGLISQ